MTAVVCKNLTCIFDNDTPAVQDLNFTVDKGEILAVVGPSGCGKTTTLRLIAGFERPTRGEIHLQGKLTASRRKLVPPEKRGVSMMFQEHALFPHLTAFENVCFGLTKSAQDQETAHEMLELVGLDHLSQRYPHELSGGERQRIALARAMAPQPILILFDEPFSNLDADRRSCMREEVRAILKSSGSTAVFVTHDQEEALFMGDRIAVINQGRMEQVGPPEIIFHRPSTRFVAEFMGSTDFLPGEVTGEGIRTEIGLLEQHPPLPDGTPVEIALRSDDVSFAPGPESNAVVLERQFKGAYNVYRLQLHSGQLVHAMSSHTRIIPPDTAVRVYPDAGHDLACFYQGKLAVNGQK
jgi:iron(III) transport system ATP-binding protein